MKKLVAQIKFETKLLTEKTEEELVFQIEKIKLQAKTIPLENLITEWYAIVQEIGYRKIGLRHFDTQLLAGLFLHEGTIVEMKTGEGKTLASTLPISLNALKKKGVHVVTVNEYLAERDKNWMGKIYQGLNLSVGLVQSNTSLFEKKKNYECDITYLTNSEVVFDYLRDNSSFQIDELVQRPFDYCIIDEIDSILIDEARTPLILSMSEGEINRKKLFLAKIIANSLEKDLDFELDEKRREIHFTEKGYQEVKKKLGKESLYDLEDPWILEILNALKAKYLFKLNKDYIITNEKVVIVDEFTGRVMEDRRWNMGIHEAIEMKENVKIGNATKTKTSITYQNFFTLYPKLSGMTGTAKTAEKEFRDIYNLKVIVLPTSKPMIRKDLPDCVYQTEIAKWKAVLKKAKECSQTGQPLLIGTSNVEKSEFLSELFNTSEIKHKVLNAKPENLINENEIVAQAGEPYAITIATNMAGRGTDIILGGNPSFKVKQIITLAIIEKIPAKQIFSMFSLNGGTENLQEKQKIQTINERFENFVSLIFQEYQKSFSNNFQEEELQKEIPESTKNQKSKKNNKEKKKEEKLKNEETSEGRQKLKTDILNLPYSLENSCDSLKNFYQFLYEIIYEQWTQQNQTVKKLGGLFVLGTERHETRRIDNQLRGRAGRQGDPGFSQFFVCLDDELIKIFGAESIRRWLNYLMTDPDSPLESDFLTNSLEQAQKKVELYNFEIRKNVFQYDEIINRQRKKVSEIRKQILSSNLYNELTLRYAEFNVDDEFSGRKTSLSEDCQEKLEKLEKYFPYWQIKKNSFNFLFSEIYREIWISVDLRFSQSNFYQLGLLKNTQNQNLLYIIDCYWTEHLERMDYIRDTINWRSYGQQNPLIEYNTEAFHSYKLMLTQIRGSMLYFLLENPLVNFS